MFTLALGITLTACGGGGSSEPAQPSAAPPATAPACTKVVAKIQFFGDSVNKAIYESGHLQAALADRFGADAFIIINSAAAGTNGDQLIAGTDGVNMPWPLSVVGNIVLTNDGLNSEWMPQAHYAANYRQFGAVPGMVFQTPNPVTQPWNDPAYAQTVRDVGKELGVPVADTYAYTLTVPDWQSHLPDGKHPDDYLMGLIVRDVITPVVVPMVAKLRCE